MSCGQNLSVFYIFLCNFVFDFFFSGWLFNIWIGKCFMNFLKFHKYIDLYVELVRCVWINKFASNFVYIRNFNIHIAPKLVSTSLLQIQVCWFFFITSCVRKSINYCVRVCFHRRINGKVRVDNRSQALFNFISIVIFIYKKIFSNLNII